MAHLGQYPTLYISLKDIRAGNWKTARGMLVKAISDLVEEHQCLWEKSAKAANKKSFKHLLEQCADDTDLQDSLRLLSKVLYEVTGKPVVLLIDEYDTPIIEARAKGYQLEMLEFLKSWLGSALKPAESEILYRAVVTGILRIARESLFSELNNLDVSTLLMYVPRG